jgi:hypothetical protein
VQREYHLDREGFYRELEAEETRRLREEWTVEDDKVKRLRDEWEIELGEEASDRSGGDGWSSDEEDDDEEEKVAQEEVKVGKAGGQNAEVRRLMEGNRMMYGGLPAKGRVEAKLIKTVYVDAEERR